MSIMKIIEIEHHGKQVFGQADLVGKHREHCLCYGCEKFFPGQQNNCMIAERIYRICVLHNVVSPVYECPEFIHSPETEAKFKGA